MAESSTHAGHLDPEAVARLGRLEIVARTLVRGFLKGHHTSTEKGASTEFLTHRPYVQGDAIRDIDWRSYARTDRFYLKQYQDETNVRVNLILDVSASMDFGSSGLTKLAYAKCLVAAFGYLVFAQRDAVGLALVDHSVRQLVPPKATAQHLAGIFTLMEDCVAGGETDLARALDTLSLQLEPRSLVVVVSDLLDDPERIVTTLAKLRTRKLEVLVFHLLDPAEEEFPFTRWTIFEDPERPGSRVRLDARLVRALYQKNLQEHIEVVRGGCRAAAIDHTLTRTSMPFEEALARYLEARNRRRG